MRFLIILLLFGFSAAGQDLTADKFLVPQDQTLLDRIDEYFPERKVNPEFVNENEDPILSFFDYTDLSITFISEGAGYRNTFGYYLLDENQNLVDEQIIFRNASALGSGGSLRTGDTVHLGYFSPDYDLGFFLKANGYRNPRGNTYYTSDSMNPDKYDHVATYWDTESKSIIMGIEDLWKGGDKDYNDLIVRVSSTETVALETAALSAGIYPDRPAQELEGVSGMVRMSVAIYAQVTSFDDFTMYPTDPAATDDVTFIGRDAFMVESNFGVLLEAEMTPLSNGEDTLPVTFSLDDGGHLLYTSPSSTHKAVHIFSTETFVEQLTAIEASQFSGQARITVSVY